MKPSNVLVCTDGRVVLSDFGIARSNGDASLTSTGLVLGSPAYISPERARGEAPGPPSDLWSLGATLFSAAEGRAPYDTGNPLTTLTAVVSGADPEYLLSGRLTPVLTGLLALEPADRPDAHAAREALQAVADSGPHTTISLPTLPTLTRPAPLDAAPAAAAGPAPSTRIPRSTGTRRGGSLVGAAVLLAVAGTGGYLAATRGTEAGPAAAQGRPTASPSAAAPADWQTLEGDGWTVRYPPGWERSSYRGQVQLKDPETRRTVRVGPASLGSSPLGVLTTTASSFATSHTNYQQITLEQRDQNAVWEMTYTDGGADLHAADHAVVLDGRGFTVFTQAKSADWDAARGQLEQIVASLRLT